MMVRNEMKEAKQCVDNKQPEPLAHLSQVQEDVLVVVVVVREVCKACTRQVLLMVRLAKASFINARVRFSQGNQATAFLPRHLLLTHITHPPPYRHARPPAQPRPDVSYLVLMPALCTRSLFLLILLLLACTMRAFVLRAGAGPATWMSRAAATTTKTSTARFSTASSSPAGAGADATATPPHPKPTMDEALVTFNRVFPTGTAGADLRPVVLFDGVCMFCNRGIDTLLALDINRKIRVAPLQSDLGRSLMTACGRDPDDLSSMLVVEADKRLSLKSDAAIRIAEVAAPHPLLGGALEKAAKMLLPQGMRDGAYDQVAVNRYSIMGKRDECRLPDPGDDRFIA